MILHEYTQILNLVKPLKYLTCLRNFVQFLQWSALLSVEEGYKCEFVLCNPRFVPIFVLWLFRPTEYNNVLFITYNLPDLRGYLKFSTSFMKSVLFEQNRVKL
jgi:hypothetical protein